MNYKRYKRMTSPGNMWNRRLKHKLARWCVALLLLQAAVSAYACPGFVTVLDDARARATHVMAGADSPGHDHDQGAHAAGPAVCHQHFSGEQWLGSMNPQPVSGPPPAPILVVSTVEYAVPVASEPASFLGRQTGPPLSVRFQVFRI